MEGGLSSNVNCVLILGGLKTQGFPSGASGKGANAGDVRKAASIPGWGRSPGGGNGSPLQYPCLENPMDRWSLAGWSPLGRKEVDTTEAT